MTITKEKRAEYETLLEYLGRATGTSLCRESAVVIRELLAEIDATFPQGRAAGLEEEREAFELDYAKEWHKASPIARIHSIGQLCSELKEMRVGATYGEGNEYINFKWRGWQARAALSSLPSEEAQGDARDAKRYNYLRIKVCGIGSKGFDFVNLPPMPANWARGSIAQHFDEAIDAAIAAQGEGK